MSEATSCFHLHFREIPKGGSCSCASPYRKWMVPRKDHFGSKFEHLCTFSERFYIWLVAAQDQQIPLRAKSHVTLHPLLSALSPILTSFSVSLPQPLEHDEGRIRSILPSPIWRCLVERASCERLWAVIMKEVGVKVNARKRLRLCGQYKVRKWRCIEGKKKKLAVRLYRSRAS